MNPGVPQRDVRDLWKPHPDDDGDVHEAMRAVDRGELLSPASSEAFVRWLEGADNESWRVECSCLPAREPLV
jgi:hypothetical protein